MVERPAAAGPSPIACDECRQKHLKCDAAVPACGRCHLHRLACTYTASRRGRARRSRPPQGVLPSPQDTTSTGTNGSVAQGGANIGDGTAALLNAMPTIPTTSLSRVLPETDREYLINLFYLRFYAAHPVIVPRAFYAAQAYPEYLDLVICFIGHHFGSPISAASALCEAVYASMAKDDDQTVPRIQALTMFAIILHARHQLKEAEQCVARAVKVALAIGVNHPGFAKEHAAGQQVAEESIRRTWWELYIVDVCIAALHHRSSSETKDVQVHPLLPCAQVAFEAGRCDPFPPTLKAFEERVFALDNLLEFSSYCYRIEAVRILDRVVALTNADNADPDSVQAVDNALASWKFTLPPTQPDVISLSGEVDEMLFQAHCFVYCASMLLHFSRSDLPAKVPSPANITCLQANARLIPTSTQHTVKTIAASKGLSDLAAVPWPLDKHSPLFICGLILGCVVQLAAASTHQHQCGLSCLQQHRDRVVLMFSALKSLGEKWAIAQNAVSYLKGVAENVFSVRVEGEPGAIQGQESQIDFDGSSQFQDVTGVPWLNLFAMSGFLDEEFGGI